MLYVLNTLRSYGLDVYGVEESYKELTGLILVDKIGYQYIVNNKIKIRGRVIELGEDEDLVCKVLQAIVIARGGTIPAKVMVIGIDFGKSIGVALILDSSVVIAKSFRNNAKALEEIMKFIACLDAERKMVRIGIPRKEDPSYESFIDKLVKVISRDVALELVPEKGSSKQSSFLKIPRRMDEDALAAINIALARTYE